ncbi:MAG: hypothetical protein ACE5JU_08845 [Candidatus Binatia bacterium]
MNDLIGHLGGVSRFYRQLDEKISEQGGLGNLFELCGKIRESLEAISLGELESLLVEIRRAKEALDDLEEAVGKIRVLKEALDSSSVPGIFKQSA